MNTPNGKVPKHFVSTFYHFKKLENVDQIKTDLETKADQFDVRGLIILGTEGFNATVSARSVEALDAFKSWIQDQFNCHGLFFKDSHAYTAPFRRFKVKIREEIVTTGIPGVMPPEGVNHHLSPDEWNRVMKEEKDYVIIDTRNWYEYNIGTFKGAINPNIEKFTDFPKFMEEQGIEKDKKMLIFCTGGIRCEKGILELQEQGYKNVFQLEGGIINYIAKHPNDQFEGECFVFDHRVALDQNLEPSEQYGLCPHCGQPAEKTVDCIRCDHPEKICNNCLELEIVGQTCSKNCAHQWKLHPGKKGPHQLLPFELEKMQDLGQSPEALPTIQVTKKKKVTLNPKGIAVTVEEKRSST